MGTTGRVTAGLVAAWAAALAANRSLVRVRGGSMAPTLDDGDVVLTRPARRLRRGDVVVLRDPRDRDERRVKRVLGLGGERVALIRGRLAVDDVRHTEPYASGRGAPATIDVPPDHVAVLGDARSASTDSRRYGPVPLALVERVAVARVHPRPRLLRDRPVALRLAGRSVGAA